MQESWISISPTTSNQLRDAVRRWVDKGYGFERRRGIAKAGGFDARGLGELAELGLPGLAVPEAHGGMGIGAVEAMVVMEELGRGIVLEPLAPVRADRRADAASASAGARCRSAVAAEDRRRRGAGRAGAPGARGALPPGRTCETTATRDGGGNWLHQRHQEHRAGRRPGRRLHRAGARQRRGGRPDGIALFLVDARRRASTRAATARRTAPRRRGDAGRRASARCCTQATACAALEACRRHRHRRPLRRSRGRDGQDGRR